jgi:hypothetical protein
MHPDLEPQQSLARRLRELPEASAAPYDWREFERRCGGQPAAGRRLAGGRVAVVAAVLALGALAVWIRVGGGAVRPAPPQPAPPGSAAADVTPARASSESLPPLGAPAAIGERWLESLPSEPAVVRVGTHAAVTGLEDRIAQLDDLLSVERLDEARPGRLLALQHERTRLLGALVQVRYAETLAEESR